MSVLEWLVLVGVVLWGSSPVVCVALLAMLNRKIDDMGRRGSRYE